MSNSFAKKFVIFEAVLAVAAAGGFGSYKYVESVKDSEINGDFYGYVANMDHPVLKAKAKELMADGKITVREYDEIYNLWKKVTYEYEKGRVGK